MEKMITESIFNYLLLTCKDIKEKKISNATEKLSTILHSAPDESSSNDQILSNLIATAMLTLTNQKSTGPIMDSDSTINISRPELFSKLSEAFPFVYTSHDIANQYIINNIEDREYITIFDTGIGKGLQLIKLLNSLQQINSNLKVVSIIGLDVSNSCLTEFNSRLNMIQPSLSFNVNFYSINKDIQEFTQDDYQFINYVTLGDLFINAAFTLHHIADAENTEKLRIEIFKKIYALKPAMITVIEPHSDHVINDLPQRLKSAWNHYKAIFDVIDESEISPSYKFLLKKYFFGRELFDIFGLHEHYRIERHELTESWMKKFKAAGFKPVMDDAISIDLPEYCDGNTYEGYTSLKYNGITLVSILALI